MHNPIFDPRHANKSVASIKASQPYQKNMQYMQQHPNATAVARQPVMANTSGGLVPSPGGLLPHSNNANHRILYCEVLIQNASLQQVPFPDLQQLTGKIIIGMEAYSVSQVPVGPVTGNPVYAAATAFNYAFLQLNDNSNTAIVDRMAVTSLNPQLNAGIIRKMAIKNVVWTNSKLFFANGATLVANTVAYFVIHYLEPDMH